MVYTAGTAKRKLIIPNPIEAQSQDQHKLGEAAFRMTAEGGCLPEGIFIVEAGDFEQWAGVLFAGKLVSNMALGLFRE
jgi:hypothetical protein